MPFGKHKGQDIKDVPEKYLNWFLKNCGDADPDLFKAVRDQLGKVQPPGTGTDGVYGSAYHYALKTTAGLAIWRDKTRAHLMTFFPEDAHALNLVDSLHAVLLSSLDSVREMAEKHQQERKEAEKKALASI